MLLNIDGVETSIGRSNDPIHEANSLLDNAGLDHLILPPKEVLYDYEKFFTWAGGVLHPRIRDENNRPIRILNAL